MRVTGTPGLHWLAGAAVAALLIPALALGLGVAFWVALPVALAAGAGGALLLAPRALFEGMDEARIGRGRIEFARELLSQADPAVQELETAARAIRDAGVRARVEHLAAQARRIVVAVEQDPSRLDGARRFLTYYLPRAAEMADGYRLLESKPLPDAARLHATADLLDRLDAAFARFEDALFHADVAQLDIELKLLGAALDDDLGPVARTPVAQVAGAR